MEGNELDALSMDLFRTFARCEYALKAAGFYVGRNDVKADWRTFANSIGNALDDALDPALSTSIDYIRNHPPRKQVIRDERLDWDDTAPEAASNADLLLAYVRRVRNNLFHGGKFNGQWFEPERSTHLLTHSLCILQQVIEMNPRVRDAYHSD